jgi:hypothetical protein
MVGRGGGQRSSVGAFNIIFFARRRRAHLLEQQQQQKRENLQTPADRYNFVSESRKRCKKVEREEITETISIRIASIVHDERCSRFFSSGAK